MRPSDLCLYTLTASSAWAAAVHKRQVDDRTVTVDLSANRGPPPHHGAAFIYGIPDTPNQIPDSFYTDMGFNYARAGGAQLEAGGWLQGPDEYAVRFESTRSNYNTARKYNAPFILLPHDIWGTDQSNSSTVWPGDNGDWTDYDAFLEKLCDDLAANNMLDGLIFDIWNEPDVDIFWKRSIDQWVDLYIRTHNYIRSRSDFGSVQISGPTTTAPPTPTNPWWTAWMSAVSESNAVPDQYAYHLLYGPRDEVDLRNADTALTQMRQQYGLPARPVNVNEYAIPEEQVPSTSAWFLSRFDRYDTAGLRANWLSTCQLHDFMGNLVSKDGAPGQSSCDGQGYFPNGEYQLYKYFNMNMTGYRAATEGSGDGLADAYTTIDSDTVRTLAGVRLSTGTWLLTINNLGSVGLPASGELPIQTWAFTFDGLWSRVDAPQDRGVFTHTYSDDSVTFEIRVPQEDQPVAFAFEFGI